MLLFDEAAVPSSYNLLTFLQERQAQSFPHDLEDAKHSQYILMHYVFLQLHPTLFFLIGVVSV
jgi:hypothetical protein